MTTPLVFGIAFLLAVLQSASAMRPVPPPSSGNCSACEGAQCAITENIRVNKLCAAEICVDGQNVLVGDGNACTTDDVTVNGTVVHAPVKDCCRAGQDADCAQWAPDVCHLSECISEPGAQYGVCVHEKLHNCCGCVADCPARVCQLAECVPTDEEEPLFTKRRPDDVHFSLIHKTNQIVNAPGECRYTAVPISDDCCLESSDCVNGGANTVGICDGAHKCIYVNSLQFECTTDAECHENVAETERCHNCGKRCADNVCVRGFCECTVDGGNDQDSDGVPCAKDCDDTNPAVNATIFCTVGNATTVNEDNDRFVKCGTKVEELCALTCPPGRVQVNETQLDEAYNHKDKKERFVRYDCDCCDQNANNTAPDEYIYCAKDANGNGVFGPVSPANLPPGVDADLTPPGCYDKVCVIQPIGSRKPRRRPRHKDDEDTEEDTEEQTQQTEEETADADSIRDAQCQAAFGSPDFVFVPPELRIPDAQCDQCEDVPGADPEITLADIDCPATALIKNKTIAACSIDTVLVGTTLEACCDELLELPEDISNLPEPVRRWRKCCKFIDDEFDGFPANPNGTECDALGDAGEFPLTLDTCGCEEHPTPCKHTAHCVPDRDDDGFFSCKDQKVICVDKLPKGCNPDQSPAKIETAICRAELGDKWGGLTEALNGQDNNPELFGSNTFCDCDDDKPAAHQKIACIKDADGDGIPFCDTDRKPKCQQFCDCDCPKGWLSQAHKIANDTGANCLGSDKKKRSTLADLHVTLAKRGLPAQVSGHGGPPHHGGHDEDDTEEWWTDEDETTERTKTHGGPKPPHKPKEPRVDELCGGWPCITCDCCDIDKLVYEDHPSRQRWSSSDPTKCGNFDYNCDGIEELAVACPKAKEADIRGDPRVIFGLLEEIGGTTPANGIGIVGGFDGTNPEKTTHPVGECDQQGGDCVLSPGWSLEGTIAKKRNVNGPQITSKQGGNTDHSKLPKGCDQFVEFVFKIGNSTVMAVPQPNGPHSENNGPPAAPRLIKFGDCGDWIEECHKAGDQCSPDCSLCTSIGY